MNHPNCNQPNCPYIAVHVHPDAPLPVAGMCDYCRLWAQKHPDRPRPVANWIVNELGEFGVEIDGVPHFYYKWPDATPSAYEYRVIDKCEFGETIKAQNFRGLEPAGQPARADSVVFETKKS